MWWSPEAKRTTGLGAHTTRNEADRFFSHKSGAWSWLSPLKEKEKFMPFFEQTYNPLQLTQRVWGELGRYVFRQQHWPVFVAQKHRVIPKTVKRLLGSCAATAAWPRSCSSTALVVVLPVANCPIKFASEDEHTLAFTVQQGKRLMWASICGVTAN